jgi:hypothetical protein
MFQPPKYESPHYHLYILHISIFCVKSTCFWFRQNTWCDVGVTLTTLVCRGSCFQPWSPTRVPMLWMRCWRLWGLPAPFLARIFRRRRMERCSTSKEPPVHLRWQKIGHLFIYRQFENKLNFRLPGLITREERFWGTVLGETRLLVAIHEGFQPGW